MSQRARSDSRARRLGELDLLVCGTRGYGPRPATLLGGVTRQLVAEARCPVAVLSGEPWTSIGALVG